MPSILLIEDDAFLAKIYSQKFEVQGYGVQIASNGEDGLRLAEREKPDVIILDILLPDPDLLGWEVLERLKANPLTQAIPVIILSNLGQREDIERTMQAGAVGYLVKAHSLPEDVIKKIKEVIGK